MDLKTSYRSPYALVLGGGATPGKRPCTRRAWITEAIAESNEIIGYVVRFWLPGKRRYGARQKIPAHRLVRCWRNEPTAQALNRARAKLPKVVV